MKFKKIITIQKSHLKIQKVVNIIQKGIYFANMQEITMKNYVYLTLPLKRGINFKI